VHQFTSILPQRVGSIVLRKFQSLKVFGIRLRESSSGAASHQGPLLLL
jgi:hypothetical protein